MAPLDPTNTNVLFLDYNDGVHDHTILWRYDGSGGLASAMSALDGVLTHLSPILYLWTVLQARQRDEGSHISNPVAWTGAATYGSGTMPAVNAPRELRFLGRAFDGRKVSFSVYGGNFSTPGTYRIFTTADSHVADVVSDLDAAAASHDWVTISKSVPTTYPYADVNFNSYWEDKARG